MSNVRYEAQLIKGCKHFEPGGARPPLNGDRKAFFEWRRIAEHVRQTKDLELTVEEFAPILAAFNGMRRSKLTVDPMAAALITTLARQLRDTASDSDSDGSDGAEPDEVDEATLREMLADHPARGPRIVLADRDEVLAGFRRAAAELANPNPPAQQNAPQTAA